MTRQGMENPSANRFRRRKKPESPAYPQENAGHSGRADHPKTVPGEKPCRFPGDIPGNKDIRPGIAPEGRSVDGGIEKRRKTGVPEQKTIGQITGASGRYHPGNPGIGRRPHPKKIRCGRWCGWCRLRPFPSCHGKPRHWCRGYLPWDWSRPYTACFWEDRKPGRKTP